MKHITHLRNAVLAITGGIFLLAFGSCAAETEKKCCEGYTGKITNEQSLKLVNQCHFLSKDSIENWTKKYDEYKKGLGGEKDTVSSALDNIAAGFLKSGSVSYNSCIIKKLLCNENSIGLRVLYGIGGDGRIHIILVGIQPDYSNLYADVKDCCNTAAVATAKSAADEAPGAEAGGLGGAEYGQIP